MFVIAFDLTTADVKANHPRSSRQAYLDIERTLEKYGFERVQWSVFSAKDEDLANLFLAIDGLRALPWFGPSVKNLKAFRMEQGSDFTAVVKGTG